MALLVLEVINHFEILFILYVIVKLVFILLFNSKISIQ